MAEICVIVGVYNAEQYLSRCLESIRQQTFADFEVILVDDGSTDRSGEICGTYAASDSRFHVIHQKNGGASASRNTGLDWAFEKGYFQWITFIDDDDYVHPLYLEALYHTVLQWGTGIAAAGFMHSHGEPLPESEGWTSDRYRTENFYLQNCAISTVQWGKLIRIDHFRGFRFPIGKLHEDEYIMYKVLFMDEYLAGIDQILYAYYQNDQSIVNSKWTVKRLDVLQAYEEQVNYFLNHDLPEVAKTRFYVLINCLVDSQEHALHCDELTNRKKKKIIRWLKKELRRVLIQYRKYSWLPMRKDAWTKGFYLNAFTGVRIAQSLWDHFMKKNES